MELVDPGCVCTDMGGARANNDADDVATGILRFVGTLTSEMSGRFLTWQGAVRPF